MAASADRTKGTARARIRPEVQFKTSEPSPMASAAAQPTFRIQATKGWSSLDLGPIWQSRELLFILAGRDIKLRYRQTALGVIWVVLQPLVAAAIFAVIFGRLVRVPSDGAPYVVFVFAALLGWNYFASAVGRAGNSLVGQANLITKIYFPRILIPLAGAVGALVDLAVSLAAALLMLVLYGLPWTWRLLTVPAFVSLLVVAAAGTSFWLSALSVSYRDFIHTTPFLLQIWLYATPVVYSTSLIPEGWRWAFSLNPVVGAVEGLRWALLGQGALTVGMLLLSTASTALVFVSGALYFRRVERSFADVI